jgi:hypothetical protein
MYGQTTLWNTDSATSSPELEDGRSRCDSLECQTTAQSGPARALASPLAQPGSSVAARMLATYGLRSSASSASVALQQSLANKLAERLDSRGSTMFALTWRAKDTPQRRQICRLAASALTTSGKGCTGLPHTLPTPSDTSNHGKSHVAGRLDEWGGSSNPFRGTEIGKVHSPGFELWVMGYPAAWRELMPPAMPSSRRSRKPSSKP